jgi:acyl-CoA thioester hydrolase
LAAGSLRFLAVNRQTFHFEHRIRYAECTVGDHVYYGRYLEILEEARGEFFRSLGRTLLQWQEADLIFPVIEVRVRYKASARYDDKVRVELWLKEMEGVRLGFEYRLLVEGRLVAEASTAHVFASLREKPRRPPPELTQMLAPYLR